MSEVWCGRGDSNPHGIATAAHSSWCVCQFGHFRVGGQAGLRPASTLTFKADLKVRLYDDLHFAERITKVLVASLLQQRGPIEHDADGRSSRSLIL